MVVLEKIFRRTLSVILLCLYVNNSYADIQQVDLESCFLQVEFARSKIGRSGKVTEHLMDTDLELFNSINLEKKTEIVNKIVKNMEYDRYMLMTKVFHECLYPGKQETFDSINGLQFCTMKNDLLESIYMNRFFGVSKKKMFNHLLGSEPHLLPISHLAKDKIIENSIEEVFKVSKEEFYWKKDGSVAESFLYKKMAQCVNRMPVEN